MRGFHFLQSQPLDRITPPWLVNPRLPAVCPPPTEPGTCHTDLSVEKRKGWGRDGGKRLIQRLNEESGRQETLY